MTLLFCDGLIRKKSPTPGKCPRLLWDQRISSSAILPSGMSTSCRITRPDARWKLAHRPGFRAPQRGRFG
jgi:hypothetical protein